MPSSPASRPSCVLAGSESLLIQCGELLRERSWGIARVVSRDPAILDWAHRHDLPTCAPGRTLAQDLAGVGFDWFLSITNLAIIPDEVISMARRGAINFHDGPLPRYAGLYTPAWAILNGETEYGVTFHEMTGGIDEGRILVQRLFPIAPDDTSLSLNTSCYAAAIEAFAELATRIEEERLEPREQDPSQRSYFGRHDRPKAAAVLDWSQPAEAVSGLVRALDFGARYPNPFAVAKVVHAGHVARVSAAEAIEGEPGDLPGRVIEVSDGGWVVACGEGRVRLSRFGCPRGFEWTPGEAAEKLGVHPGIVLGAGSTLDREALDRLNAELVPAEPFWIRRLAQLDPIEAPLRRSGAGEGAQPTVSDGVTHGRVERLSLEAGDLPASAGSDRAETLVAGFLLYLARVGGVDRFDVTLGEDALDARVAAFGELFSRHVPFAVEVDRQARATDALASLRASLNRVREKGTFLVDVIARQPELAAQPLLAGGTWTSVAIELRRDPASSALPPGSELALVVDPDGREARLVYDPACFEPGAVERIRDQLGVLLASLTSADTTVARLPLLREGDRRRVLHEWNRTAVDFDRGATIRSLFEARADATPDAPAVAFEGRSLSYRELDERASRLANHLVDLGIGPDRLVGLHLARSLDMVVGVLGVLKAGGAYVPLDPVYPADRIAYMIEDSRASVVLSHGAAGTPPAVGAAQVVDLDRDAEAIAARSATRPATTVRPDSLAYVIYTSGSTGKPKGVMVEHRNAVNFFVGMDDRIPHDPPGRWLAVTSLSFDISILELLWTLTRGFEVVVFADRDRTAGGAPASDGPWRPIDLGLALWGSDAGPGPRKYELMLEAAKFADTHGFSAVHTPERHFGAFGGPFPNPAVTSAAIAAVTKHVQIRASSCVLPLHHPIRVAEEWAVVDNLSGGRVGVSFASGWQPNDFVIRPGAYAEAKKNMFESADIVARLWRGEAVAFENPHGTKVPIATLPRPVQPELPIWITTAGNVETFRAAGAAGHNVLTHLLGQTLEELVEKVKAYRQAAAEAGRDPQAGTVTCMLHTFVGDDDAEVRRIVREPMKDYLRSSMSLVMDFAWSFPAFDRPGGPDSKPEDVDLSTLTEDETDAILEFAFERYSVVD
ncbi:MAG TPA: LLM class flavin-dependent oxidoreductase, partial [Myxococcota bacterium]|nr:LLM class flavin-dependent oxidoreductase [Myxococcota bacterium]